MKRRGGMLVEFAFSVPVLALLLAGADGARVFSAKLMAQGAARAGAQFAQLRPDNAADTAGITAAATAESPNAAGLLVYVTRFCTCGPEGATTGCETNCGSSPRLSYVQVEATVPFSTPLGAFAGLNPVRARAVVRAP